MICKEKILDKVIFINSSNANFSNDEKDLINDYYSLNFDLIKYQFENYQNSSAAFCVNLSNACNLNCDYCFNDKKNGTSIDLDKIKKYLDTCFNYFPNKDKYFVIAAVVVVFPWSTCPIVPMLTCGFVLSNFAFAIF